MKNFYPLIENYGYVIVLFGVMLGTAGIPFPSAAVLLALAYSFNRATLTSGTPSWLASLGLLSEIRSVIW